MCKKAFSNCGKEEASLFKFHLWTGKSLPVTIAGP